MARLRRLSKFTCSSIFRVDFPDKTRSDRKDSISSVDSNTGNSNPRDKLAHSSDASKQAQLTNNSSSTNQSPSNSSGQQHFWTPQVCSVVMFILCEYHAYDMTPFGYVRIL